MHSRPHCGVSRRARTLVLDPPAGRGSTRNATPFTRPPSRRGSEASRGTKGVLFRQSLRSATHAGCRSHWRKPADRLGVVRSHISRQPCPARAHERASAPVYRADDLTLGLVDDLPPERSAAGLYPQRDREEAAAARGRDPTGQGPDSGDAVRDGSASIPPTRRRRDAVLGHRDAPGRERGEHDDANDPYSVPVQRSPPSRRPRYTTAR